MGRRRHNLRTELSMDALTAVRGAVDRLVAGALGPLLDLLAEDVEFEVASGGDVPGCRKDSGKEAVADYFAALGDLLAFWRMDYSATGGRVIAWGDESFTLEGSGLEGGTEFALVLDLHQGMVTRLLVIEDLSFIPGWDSPGATVAGGRPATTRSPGTLQQPLPARGGVGVPWRLLTRPSEHVAAGPPA
jgi:ketosteroid isomerase-like protein